MCLLEGMQEVTLESLPKGYVVSTRQRRGGAGKEQDSQKTEAPPQGGHLHRTGTSELQTASTYPFSLLW